MVMRKHQRYFPVCNAAGALRPAFVTVANGPVDVRTVRTGASGLPSSNAHLHAG